MIKDDIKAALEGTTPGPWTLSDGVVIPVADLGLPWIKIRWVVDPRRHLPKDAKLIAAAPELLTRALAEIERLEAQLAELQHAKQEMEYARTARDSALEQKDEAMAALKALYKGYVNLLESGRDKIIELGGQCDPVDRMEAGSPYLREARAAIAKGAEK